MPPRISTSVDLDLAIQPHNQPIIEEGQGEDETDLPHDTINDFPIVELLQENADESGDTTESDDDFTKSSKHLVHFVVINL